MMIVTHEMDFARKISNRILFMAEGVIYEEGTPKEIFDHPKKELTRKFVQRLTSLSYKIDSTEFDFEVMNEELMAYGEKLLIEAERLTKLTLAIEEICINNIANYSDNPYILVNIEYSEKQDTLYLSVRYKAEERFDPKTSESKLFQLLLDEPTTTLKEAKLKDAEDGCQYKIEMSFKWEDAE